MISIHYQLPFPAPSHPKYSDQFSTDKEAVIREGDLHLHCNTLSKETHLQLETIFSVGDRKFLAPQTL